MKIAVVCAGGLGDALILHTASAQLKAHGFEVTTFTNHRFPFGWSEFSFRTQQDIDQLGAFDAILLQHDNTPKARFIAENYSNVYCLFGKHVSSKYGPFRDRFDYVCTPPLPLVDHVLLALSKWFGLTNLKKDNGLQIAPGATYKKFPRRVVLHTSSGAQDKNWPLPHFRKLEQLLLRQGFEPVFLKTLPSLDDLASFLYESAFFIGNDSGPGHLASYLQIPTLTLASDPESIQLWRPGWGPGCVITPSNLFKISKKHWKILLRPKRVFAQFQNLVNLVSRQEILHERPSSPY